MPQAVQGKTRDKVGKAVGMSGRNYEKAKAVVEAAKAAPKLFGHLADTMHKKRKVGGPYRLLKKAEDEKRILGTKLVEGKHRTLIIDPPWDYEWLSLAGRAAPGVVGGLAA